MISVPTTAAEADSASWQSRAACLDCDPDLFFPIAPSGPALQQIAQAKAVCARCPVRRECLQYALATRQVHGVWAAPARTNAVLCSCSQNHLRKNRPIRIIARSDADALTDVVEGKDTPHVRQMLASSPGRSSAVDQ